MTAHESLRAEARRTGRTVYQVRLERARAEAVAAGQPLPTGRPSATAGLVKEPPRRTSPPTWPTRPAPPWCWLISRPPGASASTTSWPGCSPRGASTGGSPSTPARFARLVSRWAPITVVGGEEEPGQYRLLADPDLVLILLDLRRTTGAVLFYYERVR